MSSINQSEEGYYTSILSLKMKHTVVHYLVFISNYQPPSPLLEEIA